MKIPLSSPDITEAEIEAVVSVLRTPQLSLGPRLVQFEEQFVSWLGAPHAIATSSGTAGLHLVVRALGIGEGDEVITSPFSFVASVNAFLYERARPAFVDIDPETLNLDPDRLEAAVTPRTRAIMVVHLFGRPAPMRAIEEIAARRGLIVIEDACEALGASVGGRAAGTFGRAGVFGFYPNKPITTGEGGMIVTADAKLAALCRSLRNHGRGDDTFGYARLGYNYRLSETAAAMGIVQMERLASMLARREAVARRYHAQLAGHPGLVVPPVDLDGATMGWFAYVMRLAPRFTLADRDRIVEELRRRGIGCQRYFSPLHLAEHIRPLGPYGPGSFPHTEAAADRTIALPFFNALTPSQIDEVCGALRALVV